MSLFKIGLPTDLDVKRLRERYPDSKLTPGMSITYAEACAIIGVHSEKDGRFKSVTNAWRKKLMSESGIILKAQEQKFTVCGESEKAQLSVDKTKAAARAVRRSTIIGKLVDRKALSEDQLKRFDFSQRFNASVTALQTIKHQAELPTI
jgi:hypothetical protein